MNDPHMSERELVIRFIDRVFAGLFTLLFIVFVAVLVFV